MINYVNGDLFEIAPKVKDAVIIHGANCFKTMGAGVAAIVATRFNEAYQADKNDNRLPQDRLGEFTYHDFGDFIIANAYSQFKPGANVNYTAIRESLTNVKNKFTGKHFYLPQIGAGIAGGNWNFIEKIIEDVFKNEDITVVIYK